MGETFQKRISALLLSNRRHARYLAVLVCSALVVALGVTVTLMRPGQAKTHEETVLDCQYSGNGAHTHDASCYDADGNLVCPLEEREYHVHDDSCYASETYLVCGLEEGEGAHWHDESCYDEEGNLVCGLEESEGHVHTDECWQTDTYLACGKEEVTETHTHGEGCFKTIVVEDGADEPVVAESEPEAESEPAAEAEAETEAAEDAKADDDTKPAAEAEAEEAMPEQSFKEDLKAVDEYGNEYVQLTVSVKAPKGSLPKGSSMKIKAVDEDAIADKVDEAIKAKAGEGAVVKSMTAVDISFLDKDGNEVEPAKKVEVKITSDTVRGIDAPTLVHIDKDDKAAVVTGTAKVNADDKDTTTGNEDTLKFNTDEFSPYVIVETEELHAELLTGNGGVYDVVVTATPEAGIPMDAQLQVTELVETSRAYLTAYDEVVAQKKAEDESFDEASLGMAAFDITIVDSDGNPFEPLVPVSVTVNIAQLPTEITEAKAEASVELLHLNTSTGEAVVETVATVADETLAIDGEAAVAEFELESFSTFPLTWDNGTKSATIHYGYHDPETDEFVEFTDPDKVATLDTSVASVSLENTFEGYSFIGATYKASSSADEYDMTSPILTRVSDGWEITHKTSHEEDAETVTENVANGSDIYVYYGTQSSHDPTPIGIDVPKPITEKDVHVNEDGTATITLDITGTKVTETDSVGANVLIILDRTYSMAGSMPGATSRWAAARSAINTLVTLLSTGDNAGNDIDYSLVSFYRVADGIHTWGSDGIAGRTSWTKNPTTFNNYIQNTLNYNSNMQQTGTNWESGLYQAISALNSRDNDQTYVIFLTDGEPNRRGTGNTSTSVNTAQAISAALPRATTIAGLQNVSLYGVFCGNDSGHDNLADMITNAGGVQTINGTDNATLTSAFEDIAHTIITNLGATGVSVDDGITDLSSVSATVHGTAGGYKYYYKPEGDTEFTEWTADNGAPGATYSEDNGVTWDLSNVGPLAAGTTYRIQFTVWPSQEALDLIANLNNGTVSFNSLTDDVKAQINEVAAPSGGNPGTYTLKTNTHLNTTYSFKGNTYTDPITPLASGDMPLESEKMTVEKAFAHSINAQDPFTSIVFYLTEDGKYYMSDGTTSDTLVEDQTATPHTVELPVNTDNNWQNSIYIAPGFIENGEVLETGHAYSLEEKVLVGNEYEYEFTPQTVRPMIIDGVLTYLVKEDKYNPATGTTYEIDGDTYFVASNDNEKLVGTNRKTAELDITKVVETNGILTDEQEAEETFTYRVTLNIPDGTDPAGIVGYEYVYRPDQGNAFFLYGYHQYEGGTPAATAFEDDIARLGDNKYRSWNTLVYRDLVEWENIDGKIVSKRDADGNIIWKVPASDGFHTISYDMTLKQNEVIRFTNLPTGTTYTIQEIYANKYPADNVGGDTSGKTPVSDPSNIESEGYAVTVRSTTGAVSTTDVANDTVSGTIEGLDTRFYNQFTNTMTKTVDVNIAGTKKLEGYEWSGESYHFTLTAEVDANPMPPEATGKTEFDLTAASGNADQTDTFGRLRFTAPGSYTYTVSETNAGTLQVVNGKVVQFGDAATVTINIAEDPTTHDLSVESVDGAELSEDESTVTATITNTFPSTSVSASKEWQNASGEVIEAPDDAKVTFTLYADGEATDKTIELDGEVDENGESVAWSAAFSGLDQYKVVDGQPVEIEYTIGETITYAGYELITTDPVEDGGTIINRQGTFWVQFKKTNMSDSALPDAVFSFDNGSEEELTLTSGTDGILATSGDDPVNKFELAIDDEGFYTLSEETAPDGYIKLTNDVKVYVKASGVTAEGSVKSEVTGNGTEESPYLVTITNTDGSELPKAGGPGTALFTITGSVVCVAAAVMYGISSRRRREGRSHI